ncbi:helix-turn-helix domain-containing protein [Phytohabitans suffuscus]
MPVRRDDDEPSLRSRWLGQRFRELREDLGLTLRFVAGHVGVEFADLAACERGQRRLLKSETVKALLDLYRVFEQAERDHLLRLARDAFRLPRWEGNFDGPDLDTSMLDYLWLESVAERVRCYSATLIPELVRTPAYVESVVRREFESAASDAQMAWWVQTYHDRQTFNGGPPIEVRAVVAESVLRRSVDGAGRTLPEQLEYLAKTADARRTQVRVLPAAARYVPGSDGSFTLFDLPAPYPRLAACTSHAHGLAVHDERTAEQYAHVFDRLCAAALDPTESASLISRLATDPTT